MADPPQPRREPAVEIVFTRGFGKDRLMDREIELLGSILPEFVAEVWQLTKDDRED